MKFVEFEDKHYGRVLINPDSVSSISPSNEGIISIVHGAGSITNLDYSSVSTDKALWYVIETLRLGYHPYADSGLSYRDINWERNAPKELKNEEVYLEEVK
tara:strand:+ start:185 stop:487 length:303 start_codon:yes stop_codon:yes gene_type:complete